MPERFEIEEGERYTIADHEDARMAERLRELLAQPIVEVGATKIVGFDKVEMGRAFNQVLADSRKRRGLNYADWGQLDQKTQARFIEAAQAFIAIVVNKINDTE